MALNGQSYTGTVTSGSAAITIPAADLQALTEGDTYNLTADVSDVDGNPADQHSVTSFAVDVTAPTLPTILAATSFGISGTAEAGTAIAVTLTDPLGDTSILNTSADTTTGAWVIASGEIFGIKATPVENGIYAISITSADTAGNISEAGTANLMVVEAPAQDVIGGLNIEQLSRAGDVVTYGLIADASYDLNGGGIEALDFAINFDPSDLVYIDGSLTSDYNWSMDLVNDGEASSGSVRAGYTKFGGTFTDFSTPIAEFQMTVLETSEPVEISIIGTSFDGDAAPDTSETFDYVQPRVVSVHSIQEHGPYKIGDTIEVAIEFSKVVVVNGIPQLALETGSVDSQVHYTSGSGSDTLLFKYTVQSGDITSDLAYLGTNALTLNGGTIDDTSGISAILTLPAVGGAGSLSNNSDIVVDGVRPVLEAVSADWGSVLNATEDDNDGVVTVTTDGVEDGQDVTLVLNGQNYIGTVTNNSATLTIPAADLAMLTDGISYSLNVDISDMAGNAAEQQNSSTVFEVDKTPPVLFSASVDTSSGLTGVTEEGAMVSVVMVDPTGAVNKFETAADATGAWNISAAELLSSEVTSNDNGSYAFSITAADTAGNISEAGTANLMVVEAPAQDVVGGLNIEQLSKAGDVVTYGLIADASYDINVSRH